MAATTTTTTTPYSPITETQREGDDVAVESGCFGFCVPGPGANTTWVASRFKKMKELSEIVAGPKWKNFIRRIGKLSSCNPRNNYNNYNNKAENLQLFHYSPESYELNFAADKEEEDEKLLLHSFSSRFANHAFANVN